MTLPNVSSTSLPKLARYDIQVELGSGGMGVVYRAVDRLTGSPVALKQVVRLGQRNTAGTEMDVRIALAQEFRTLASIRHPNIISVLDYGFHEGNAYYTMELLDDSQTIVEAAKDQPYDTQIAYLIQVMQALAYLHNRNIVHRDLKPDNLLVIDGHVKVLDFGLATARDFVSDEYQQVNVMGTMAYMAPEVIQGQAASRASDLYAVGLIAYEMLAQHYPYTANDVAAMLTSIVGDVPDMAAIAAHGDGMLNLLNNLLTKSPRRRYQSATVVLALLREEIEATDVSEDLTIRESYLQAAQFVGRRDELHRLTDMLDTLIETVGTTGDKPHGSFWLIAGEAGVGKSRLLEELRIRAQVNGALVLRGQGVASGDANFRIWQSVIRELSLYATMSDIEAAVLKLLVPDIEALMGHSLPHAITLDQISAQERLFEAVQSLLKRAGRPILIILEDLHWARQSLVLLRRLMEVISELPVMIVGSYRDEEAPDLAAEIGVEGDDRVIQLQRLTQTETADLSRSMLGEAGERPEVIELMQRETEGNAFFIVEVARTLAEITGKRTQIGRMTLPAQVFSGGIRTIVEQRLARLPREALPPLSIAATVGRVINQPLMKTLIPALDLDRWLGLCQQAAVLDVNGTVWRFSHDKIREGILQQLPSDRAKAIHQQVAMGIEKMVGESGLASVSDDLFYHWSQTDNRARRTRYAALAGRQALNVSDYTTAAAMLTTAVDELSDADNSESALAPMAHALAEAHYGLSHMENTMHYVDVALRAMDMPTLPGNKSVVILRLIVQMMRQLRRRLVTGTGKLRPTSEARQNALVEASRLHLRAAQASVFLNDPQCGALSALYALNLSEQAGRSKTLAFTYAGFGYLCAVTPALRSQAAYYLGQAETLGLEILQDGTTQEAVMSLHVTSVARTGLGEIVTAMGLAKRAARLFELMRDMRHWGESVATHAFLLEFSGEFEQARVLRQRLYERGLATNNMRPSMWGLAGLGQIALYTGDFSQARTHFAERSDLSEREAGLASDNLTFSTYLCLLYWRMGREARAIEHLQTASDELEREGFTQVHSAYVYLNTAEVAVRAGETSNDSRLRALARLNIERLERFAGIFPLIRAHANVMIGLHHWQEGRQRKAQRLWQQALDLADDYHMPYVAALAHLEIGRHLPSADTQRIEHLNSARALFKHVGAKTDADAVPDS